MNDAERFEQIFLSQVTRPGADKLLEWLKSTDFFTAPASTRFHGAYPGGLEIHRDHHGGQQGRNQTLAEEVSSCGKNG